MLKILLSFSNNLIAQGIHCILSGEDDLQIYTVKDPGSLNSAVNEYKPDVVIVDYYVIDYLFSRVPENTKILLLDTGCGEEKINYALIAKNISGVIEVNSDVTLLKKALATVSKGHLWINRKVISKLVERLSTLSRLSHLTQAEQGILSMLGEGMDDSGIAHSLGTRESRVRLHIENLKKKSNAKDRQDLISISRDFCGFYISSN